MNTQLRFQSRHRTGAVAVLVAISLVAVFGVAALAVDVGRLFCERRNAQAAADAAADAAGIELYAKYQEFQGRDSDGDARASALAVAAINGYSASEVVVNIPPTSGPYARQDGFAEVLIKSNVKRAFSSIYSSGDLTVCARAVAAGTLKPSKASVLVLDPTRKDPLKLQGFNSELKVAGDVVVNSTNKRAVKVGKRAQIVADNLLVAGGLDKKSKGLIDATIATGVEPTSNPLASLPMPAKGSTRNLNDFKVSSGGQDVYNLQPGNYKALKFDGDDVVNLAPGVYYVDTEVSFKGSSSLAGSEVMIFNAGNKGFKFHTLGTVTLSPPISGTYEGLALFQGGGSKTKVEFSRDKHLDLSGIIYAPQSEVKFKSSDLEMDEDWETESDEYTLSDDAGYQSRGSLSASIICRRLTIAKSSHVQLHGADIASQKPILGLIE